MASSFIDDLLGKKIDENEVSAMRGSLESQLASSTGSSSSQNEAKQVFSSAKNSSQASNVSSQPSKQSSPISSHSANLRSGIPAPRVPATTTVIHIAPRPTPSTAVPLAPRPNTMTVLSHGGYVTAINAADLLNRNVNMINASQLRMMTGVTVPGQGLPIAPRIIPQTQPRLPAGAIPQAIPQLQTPGVQISKDSKTGRITITQAPIHSAIATTETTGVTNSTVPISNLTQGHSAANLKTMPGNVAFRMPGAPLQLVTNQTNVASSNSNPGIVATTTTPAATTLSYQNSTNSIVTTATTKPVPTVAVPPASIAQVPLAQPQARAHLEEQAAKLKNFFANLIRLASEKSPEVGPAVKDLIQKVMEGKLTEDEFASKLLTTLSSGPQPNLVGFLKKALPMLRAQAGAQLQQQQQTSQQQQQQQQRPPVQQQQTLGNSVAPKPVFNTQSPQRSIAVSPQQRVLTPATTQAQQQYRVQLTPQQQQLLMQSQSVVTLTPAQQQLLRRQQQLGSQRVLISASSGASGSGTQLPARSIVMVQARPGVGVTTAGGVKTVLTTQAKPQAASAPGTDKKHKPGHAGISSSGDDDINDVTSMAGVNLMEESQRILAINSDLLSSQTRSCRDELFLYSDPLQKKLESLVRKHGITGISQDVCGLISHATQERLRDTLEKLSVISLNRPENYRDDPRYETLSETKAQIRVFEQIDEVERKKRELREREVLMRAAKSRSRQEDPEQARLKEKAKQLQQEEEEIIRKREANNTALAAIGPRKKRKLDEALEGYNSSPGGSSSSNATFNSPRSGYGNRPQRTRRVTLKDLVFVLEQEKETSKSTLLYKALLK